MNTLKKVFLVLVMVCAFVTSAMQHDAHASHKDVYVTKRMSKVYPDLRTLERFIDVAAHRPGKIKRFMRRNDVFELDKGTRVVQMRSVFLDGVDAVVYKVRVPNRNQYGYVLAHNLKKVKNNKHRKVEHVIVYKEKHKVKYVEKYEERREPKYDDRYKVRFKATVETPILVINFL
jgi:hypothetical protein